MSLLSSIVPCDPEDQSARTAMSAEETVLRIGCMQRVDSLSPLLGLTDASQIFYGLVYDSLFSVGNDLETVGNLATSWRIVPSTDPELVLSGEPYGSVWEYDLTQNASWHDGEPFTAEDAAWVINMYAENYYLFWAYEPYTNFMQSAEVVDSDTMRIHFFERSSGEPVPVSYGDSIHIPMIPRHKLMSYEPMDLAFTWSGVFGDSSPPIVGTGPFMVTPDIMDEYLEGDQITLLRNPNYHWGSDKGEWVLFDKLVMYFYDDEVAMRYDLEAAVLDIAQFPPSTYVSIDDEVTSGDLQDIEVFDGLKCTQARTSVVFNMHESGPNMARLDPAVRRALAMATDKQTIVDEFYMGCADVGSTLISPISEDWHYEPAEGEFLDFDLGAAGQLLEDSGYVYHRGPVRTCGSPPMTVTLSSRVLWRFGLR